MAATPVGGLDSPHEAEVAGEHPQHQRLRIVLRHHPQPRLSGAAQHFVAAIMLLAS